MPRSIHRHATTLLAAAALAAAACGEHPKQSAGGPPPGADVKAPPRVAAPAAAEDLGGGVTTAALSQSIRDHVTAETARLGGAYTLADAVSGATLTLTLDKVHDDRLSGVGNDTYFACSDFKDATGKTWDVDFWVASQGGTLGVTQTLIHKEDGVARYSWIEENGTWRTDPPQPSPQALPAAQPEHPEHPEQGEAVKQPAG